MLQQSVTTALRLLFIFALIAVFVLSMLPTPDMIDLEEGRDKAWHAVAFVALALLGFAAWPGRIFIIAIGLLAYGAAIEVAQSATAHRHGDIMDWFADALGVLAAFVVWRITARIRAARNAARASDSISHEP